MSLPGRRTRSGMEFSPYALRLPTVRLADLLERRSSNSDSDTESENSDSDEEEDERPRITPQTLGAAYSRSSSTNATPNASSRSARRSTSTNATSSPAVGATRAILPLIRCARRPTAATTAAFPPLSTTGTILPLIRCARRPTTAAASPVAAPVASAPTSSTAASSPAGVILPLIRCARLTPAPIAPTNKQPRTASLKASPAEVKARKLVKKHAKDRAARRLNREKLRVLAGSRLKNITRLHLRGSVPLQLDVHLSQRFFAPVASSGWQAVRQDEKNPRGFYLGELLAKHRDMQVVHWNGEPTPLVDADDNILVGLGGFPPDRNGSDWQRDVAKPAAEAMRAAAIQIYSLPRWMRKRFQHSTNRRGGHAAKSVGPSMGGGQPYPQNLSHTPRLLAIFSALFALKCFERLAGWGNTLFEAFSPDLFNYYRAKLAEVSANDPRIHLNFPLKFSVFSTATFNFGPATITLPHIDFRNLAWGWCSITALGDYDPDFGGHLVLWDLKLIIRFPPGSTIFIPSAILRHSNTNIRDHEFRFSFTQFTPAAIFRWAYNGFRTDKDVEESKFTTAAEHEQRRRDKERRWKEGIKMYQKWEGPIRTL